MSRATESHGGAPGHVYKKSIPFYVTFLEKKKKNRSSPCSFRKPGPSFCDELLKKIICPPPPCPLPLAGPGSVTLYKTYIFIPMEVAKIKSNAINRHNSIKLFLKRCATRSTFTFKIPKVTSNPPRELNYDG